MTGDRTRRPLHPLGLVGLLALLAGLAAWVWLGDWRLGATGLLALVLLAALGAAIDGQKG